ncbi:MAG: cupin domain-containing protein [Steroidobacteraceae bacterium]
MSPAELVQALQLSPHPEGGYFRETYRATQRDAGGRAASTLIYFLLAAGQVSRLHRIDADESWHLYLGGPLRIHELDDTAGVARTTVLGRAIERGERPQHVVPGGRWFGAELALDAPFALVGCAVAPGFEFTRFELAQRGRLLPRFAAVADLIGRLT